MEKRERGETGAGEGEAGRAGETTASMSTRHAPCTDAIAQALSPCQTASPCRLRRTELALSQRFWTEASEVLKPVHHARDAHVDKHPEDDPLHGPLHELLDTVGFQSSHLLHALNGSVPLHIHVS